MSIKIEERPHLLHIYSGKRDHTSRFNVVGPKEGGSSIGSIFEKEKTRLSGDPPKPSKRWMGKIGAPNRLFSGRVGMEGVNLSLVREKIASDCYKELGKDVFLTPKTRLSNLPIIDPFTQSDPKLPRLLEALSPKDGIQPETLSSLRIMSQMVEGFVNLGTSYGLDPDYQPILFWEYIRRFHSLPDGILNPEGVKVPLFGLIELLAVGRLLADVDIFGANGENVGIVWNRDQSQRVTHPTLVKVGAGTAFSFNLFDQNSDNWVINTLNKSPSFQLNDLRDLQLSTSDRDMVIRWSSLSLAQKKQFLSQLVSTKKYLEQPNVLSFLLYRNGMFNLDGTNEIFPREIAVQYEIAMRRWLDQQLEIYGADIDACHKSNSFIRSAVSFGNHSYLVDNSSLVKLELPENKISSYIELDGAPLSTIGYNRKGIDFFLRFLEQKYGVKITHLVFQNDIIKEEYQPSINLMDREFHLEGIVQKVTTLIDSIETEPVRLYNHLVALSFSKLSATERGPRRFFAHISPLIIRKLEEKILLFIFDKAASEVVKRLVEIKENIHIYDVQGLVHSSLSCNIFSLLTLKQFARDPELVDYMIERAPPFERSINIPLLPPYLPSKLMRLSDSINQKLLYLSRVETSISRRRIDVEDVLQTPCASATLVRVQGLQITTEQKNISPLLYTKNIVYALKLNQEESLFRTRLAEELERLSSKTSTLKEVVFREKLFDSPFAGVRERSLEQPGQSQAMFDFFKTLPLSPFLYFFETDLPIDFHRFSEAFALDEDYRLFGFFDFLDRFGAPPTKLLTPEYVQVPLRGLMFLLGVLRSIADVNALGEFGRNSGFVWVRDEKSTIIAAQAVKIIDRSSPFIFKKQTNERCTYNVLINSQQKLGSPDRWVKDLRDIQTEMCFTSTRPMRIISWQKLSSEQQTEFKSGVVEAANSIKSHHVLGNQYSSALQWAEEQSCLFEA